MTEPKRWSIADLMEGRVVVRNDGTHDEFVRVTNLAFPGCHKSSECDKYRYAITVDDWRSLPVQSVADFLSGEEKQEFENGDVVEIQEDFYIPFTKEIWFYIGKISKRRGRHHAVINEQGLMMAAYAVRYPDADPVHYATQSELIAEGIESLSKRLGKEVKIKSE